MKKEDKIQLASIDQCTGCAACASICPTNSITMREDQEGFMQPHIDADTCIKCHKCEKTCPIITPIEISTDFDTQVYAAINKDEAVRMRSSSGGMFYALAKWTIEQGGVVFGARFDDKWDVIHDYTETIEGIEPFMRSKYVQSRIGDTFKQTKDFLKKGRQVLFVGTPCQIGGLHAYLGKDYENLIMVDFICHGVPSPGVWRKYLKEEVQGNKVLDINFRDKRDGWNGLQCITITTTKTKEREKQFDNAYFKGFIDNVYLRSSCYDCQFKQVHRISDLTMADYWGVQSICPEWDDDKGTSAVFVHTAKGANIYKAIEDSISSKSQKINDVTKENTMISMSVVKPCDRSKFFLLWRLFSYGIAMKIIYFKKRISRKLKKILKKIMKR